MRGMTADATREQGPVPISLPEKVALLARVWVIAAQLQLALRRHRLPELTASVPVVSRHPAIPPALLSRAVTRGLRIGRWRPRCLLRSLVLYRMLREQGDVAELVIGLTDTPDSHDAHAWVELDGLDVGPWPGRGPYTELARYPRPS